MILFSTWVYFHLIAAQREAGLSFTTKLECKPWREKSDSSGDETTDRTLPDGSSFEDDISSSDASSESRKVSVDMLDDSSSSQPCHQKAGSQCTVCSQPFQEGQNVYTSNNPDCNHTHHQLCIENWLQYQNTCPTCNQPFVLQTV